MCVDGSACVHESISGGLQPVRILVLALCKLYTGRTRPGVHVLFSHACYVSNLSRL